MNDRVAMGVQISQFCAGVDQNLSGLELPVAGSVVEGVAAESVLRKSKCSIIVLLFRNSSQVKDFWIEKYTQ